MTCDVTTDEAAARVAVLVRRRAPPPRECRRRALRSGHGPDPWHGDRRHADARELARWWAEQTGGELDDPYDGWFVTLKGGGLPVMLAFQKVDDPTPGKNKVHLDLTSGDVDAEVDRLVAAGATLVERRGEEGFRWVTMSDPHGNLFDVASAAEATTEYVG